MLMFFAGVGALVMLVLVICGVILLGQGFLKGKDDE